MSVKMNVLASSKPHAMMSFMFSRASRRASSTVRLLRIAPPAEPRGSRTSCFVLSCARAVDLLPCTGLMHCMRALLRLSALKAAAHPLRPLPLQLRSACNGSGAFVHACARMRWRYSIGCHHQPQRMSQRMLHCMCRCGGGACAAGRGARTATAPSRRL